uniref:RIIa domain-containing protein n=1 Tax=Mesocestoides corti TaxID=53468 RepID=A0A5K3EKV1_MESCO
MQHSESDYVQRVLGEPLKDALAAIVLYQPLDPIEFLANYLRYWAVKVRDYRRSERIRVEEEERRRQAELKRVRELTDKKSSLSTDKMRFEVAHFVLEEVIEMGTDVVFKAWKKAELERRKAEKAAQRAAKEAEEEGEDEEEEED